MHCCTSHAHCQSSALAKAEAFCAAHGLRFTDARRQVFEILWQSHTALSAAEIMMKCGHRQPPITYRALHFLTGHGLIHHVTSINAYVGCTHIEPDHAAQLLVCSACHAVTEIVPDTSLKALQANAVRAGFQQTQTHIETLGLCPACHL